MRAVIYARYSSENQREASIEDQVRLCRDRIEREGWSQMATYTDHAISGASRLRPGYQKLLEDARASTYDVVVSEALDRLSRDQDNQRDASIEDQVRICRERIDRENWSLVATYTDHAISGASRLRPGYQKLLEDARAGSFDVVVAEALDRLSRDQEDVAGLYKQLGFCSIKLVTIAEGEISELHVGLKGTMNALYLKDLAQKTRRGLEGRVRAGRSGGGNAYGYDVVREVDAQGEPVRGGRSINEAEAAVVRRIFGEFAAGTSPTAIARKLNTQNIPGPRGRRWGHSTIRGHALRRTGILHNELYVGRLVWNKQRYVKDPHTSKRLARLNPESEWVIQDLPELRIVDNALWEKVQTRLGDIRESPRVAKARKSRFWERRRARHLLTGLVRCGCCGSALAAVGRDYLACPSARSRGTCNNRKGIRRDHLEALVLTGLKERLMQPDLVKEFVTAFNEEINRGRHDVELAIEARRRELARVVAKLEGLTTRSPMVCARRVSSGRSKALRPRKPRSSGQSTRHLPPHRASIRMSRSSIAARSRTCTRHSAPTTRAPRPPTSCAA